MKNSSEYFNDVKEGPRIGECQNEASHGPDAPSGFGINKMWHTRCQMLGLLDNRSHLLIVLCQGRWKVWALSLDVGLEATR